MQAFVVTDDQAAGQRIRTALAAAGYDCPLANVTPLKSTAEPLPGPGGVTLVPITADPARVRAAVAALGGDGRPPVVVVGKSADARLVLRAVRAGAADFVDEQNLEGELVAALGRLLHRPGRTAEPARTISVLGPSGGSGASTIAVNIATALATEHRSALLIDLNLHTGDSSTLLDLRPEHTLAELCQNVARLDRTMFDRSLARHASGVHLLAPPPHHADVQYITPDGVRQVLGLARSTFPYVVIDLDHTFAPEQVEALRQTDLVVLVLRLDFTCLRNARRAMEQLDQLGISREAVRVVVNRYGRAREIPAGKAEEALGVRIGHYIPDDPKSVNRANNNGVPVVRESPSARVSRSLTELAASVNGRAQRRT
jgi:pilus assembly protein CpaE